MRKSKPPQRSGTPLHVYLSAPAVAHIVTIQGHIGLSKTGIVELALSELARKYTASTMPSEVNA